MGRWLVTTRAQCKEAERLRLAYEEALRLKEVHDGSFGSDEAEQRAWDAWIDHIEASGLNYTSYDPRP